MSVKRQATTELNHDNWDDDEPVVQEDLSGFKVASKDILEKRVIRTAKRRSQISNEEPKKSVFSGFGGFNKQQPASFDFLSKITNANNESNSKADSSVTSSLFTSKPITSSPSTGLFSIPTSTATSSKSLFGTLSSPSGASSNNTTPTSIFTSKADSTVTDSPFKLQTVTSSTDSKIDSMKTTISTTFTSSKSVDHITNSNVAKSSFSPTTSLFQTKPVTNTTQRIFGVKTKDDVEEKNSEDKNDGKMKYYSKLKHLNESVSQWIKKHVEQTPLCILTPIFKDYEKYIKQIQDEYQEPDNKENKGTDKPSTSDEKSAFGSLNTNTSVKDSTTGSNVFAIPQSSNLLSPDKPTELSFGIKTTTTSSSIATSSPPTFSFGFSPKTTQTCITTSSPFSIGTTSTFSFASNTSTNTTNGSSAPFSFGTGKPFSFNSNVIKNTEKTEENNKEEDEDTPPKVEYTPVVEKDSVYDKKCKIFVKKDGNFVDKGVGTLYIKKIEDSEKHQLLVRANTNLGTILVNLILVSSIPSKRMGKNNVMMVCIPTPDAKPPPTPILIRVKTPEEADELLATLDKYKK